MREDRQRRGAEALAEPGSSPAAGDAPGAPEPRLADAWLPWVTAAGLAGEPALMERLAAAIEPRTSDRTTPVRLAAAALGLGRAAEAQERLRDAGVTGPAGSTAESWQDLLAGATAAACGDDDAYGWLVAEAVRHSGTPVQGSIADLLETVAECRGDLSSVDDALRTRVVRDGVRDPWTVARFAAQSVNARYRRAGADELRAALAGAADTLISVTPDGAPDRRPVDDALDHLETRGDGAGIILLQRTMSRRGAGRRRRVTHRPAWYPLLATLAIALVGVAGWFGPPAVTLAAVLALPLGTALWQIRLPRPGLTLGETRAWRTIGSGARGAPDQAAGIGTVLAVIGAFIVGVVVAIIVADPFDSAPRVGWAETRVTAVWIGAIILPCWGAFIAVRRLNAFRAVRRARRGHIATRLSGATPAEGCQCMQIIGYTDSSAIGYLAGHLVPVVDGPAPATVRDAVGDRAVLAACPDSGILWLCGPLGRYARALALRGPLPPVDEPVANTGFYL